MSNIDTGGTGINPPAKSKINWAQMLGIGAMILTYFGIDLPPEVQAAAATAIGSAVMVLTWVFRTFFTG